MSKKYIITQEELDLLERARLELVEMCDGNSPLHDQLLFVTELIRSKLWKIVNRKRDEVKWGELK